jgi:hypothetical protein
MIVTSAGNDIVNVTGDGGVDGVCAPAAQPASAKHARPIASLRFKTPNLMKNLPIKFQKLRQQLSTFFSDGVSLFVPTIFAFGQISACAL